MEALRAMYGTDDDLEEEEENSPDAPAPPAEVSPADSRTSSATSSGNGCLGLVDRSKRKRLNDPLPPPPLDLLRPPNSPDLSTLGRRIRSFPHVEGNYALHVYIPVLIPATTRMQLASFVKKISSLVPGLHAVDTDYDLTDLCKDNLKLEEMLLGREFHISLGRAVPIQVHQIDSIISMLRNKFQSQRRFWIDFSKWEVFINDEQTRTFLSLEVLGTGLPEITKQIQIVDQIYRLHGLPEFYRDPRPHISLLWALGDISHRLKQVSEKLERSHVKVTSSQRHIFVSKFSRIECKVGKKTYKICNLN